MNLQELGRALPALLARIEAAFCRARFAGCMAPAERAAAAAAAATASSSAGASASASAASLLAATSAAALAAAALGTTVALCEAAQGGADPASVRQAVLDLWHKLDEQLHRVEAALPSGKALQSIPEPEVIIIGPEVEVTFRLPQELDIPGAVRALRRHLSSPAFASIEEGSQGSSVSMSSSSGADGKATHFVRRSRALGGLTVDVVEPHDRSYPASFTFRGRASERDLALVSAALQSAMGPRRSGPVEDFKDLASLLDSALDPHGRHSLEPTIDPLLDHLGEFMRAFEHMAHGRGWLMGEEEEEEGGGGAWPGERDTEPTPLRRPKQFDDWGGGWGGHGGAGGGGGYSRRRELEPRPRGEPPAGASAEEVERARQQEEAARRQRQLEAVAKRLERSGAQVFLPGKAGDDVDWGILAGYEQQKRQIEDTLLLALMHPEVYNEIAKGTRRQFASNRPRAVLFEGPPGTGKTTSARIIASQASVPLVYIPLESIVSKWYGESEKQLAELLKAAESFPDGCIIFLDELDALATSRSNEMHEATRRVLGVLLRHLDGFDSTHKRTVVIGATNRKQDLDPALLSRFSTSVNFGLPSESCRAEILRQYALHLSDAELLAIAASTPGMAGRDLKDVCEQAERRWASKIIRGKAPTGQLPPVAEYLEAARQRLQEMAGLGDGLPGLE